MPARTAASGLPSLPPPEQLPDDPALLKTFIAELLATVDRQQRDREALQHRLDLLLRRLYGPRGERFHPDQRLLFDDGNQGGDPPPLPAAILPPPEPKKKRRARPHGRRRMPANLPREPRHHELPAAARLCPTCGRTRVDIGVDKSEQLEYRPASLIVVEHFLHKYACPCCAKATAPSSGPTAGPSLQQDQEPAPPGPQAAPLAPPPAPATDEAMPTRPSPTPPEPPAPQPSGQANSAAPGPPLDPAPPAGVVVVASKPAMPIPKGLPGPGLLAHLIVSKYTDHLPLYRLQRIYQRQGVVLPRSTTCDWLAASAGLLRPLYDRMVAAVLQSRVLHTDDTPVKMQVLPSRQLDTARLWIYLGDAAHPYNVFDFTPNRKRDGPQRFLAHYQGYLQADAYGGYDGLYVPNPVHGVSGILEVACNAHARRKFDEARTSDVLRSHRALAYYRMLYELERSAGANQFDDEQRRRMRQDLAVPILEKFHQWLEQAQGEVLPKSPIAEAIGYALNQWTALVRYTEAGFLAIDNNVAEREMKRIAIGRKNWLFVGSAQGGATAAVLFSFTSTCQRLGVEPWAYLQDVLTRLPTTPTEALADLLPDHWQAAGPAKPAAATALPAGASPTISAAEPNS